jgi:hypothetical protein
MSIPHAKIALALIDQVRGPYDDQNLQAVMQTKDMLRRIVTGELVVAPRPKLDATPQESET